MPSATILIADISGYTEFAGRTMLRHSSYVLRELLDLIIASDELDLTISEVEGDGVLFYRLGDPIPPEFLLKQCERTFRTFHERLNVIERDRVCQCGACEKASGLTLKFVVHYGQIEEIRVADFRKAAGIDMIVAHRLLKNSLPVHDYVVVSHGYRHATGVRDRYPLLNWEPSAEEYSDIGRVTFDYAPLDKLKHSIPPAPRRPDYPLVASDAQIRVDIRSNFLEVYQTLISIDDRAEWQQGVMRTDASHMTERVGTQYRRSLSGLVVDTSIDFGRCDESSAVLVDRLDIEQIGVHGREAYALERLADDATRLVFSIELENSGISAQDFVSKALRGMKADLDRLKSRCEA